MTIELTWESSMVIFIIGSAIAGVWWKLHKRISDLYEQLQDYKLAVTKEFASVGHLKEVELRLEAALNRLTERIDELLTKVGK